MTKITSVFTLEFNIPSATKKINLNDEIFLIGSCFSNEMGGHLRDNKFKCISNPFGTIYNPHSIFKLLADQSSASTNEITESHGVYYHWDAHGLISGLTKEEVTQTFEQKNTESQRFLTNSKWLIITLGTSFVYEHKTHGIVANCHKVPGSAFKKRLLNKDEIELQFEVLHSHLTKINPELNILFTVSPVRHTRDGLIENNRSKAILIDFVHSVCDRFENVGYFPSYEILIDQLRDYRYYDSDMIHPSSTAIKFIWEKFGEAYFDDDTKALVIEWTKLRNAINHKSFQPLSVSHQQFLKNTLNKVEILNEKIDLSVELKQLKDLIK